MAIRGILYRKLVEKKEADKKANKKEAVVKKSASAQKVSVLKRFLKRPGKNGFVPAKYRATIPKRIETKEKNLTNYPKTEFKSIKTGLVNPHKLIQNKMAIDSRSEGIIKGRARYWGGHFLYPIGEAEKGQLMIQNSTLTFIKSGFSGHRSINIPVKKIDWKKVSQVVKDTAYPVTCFSIPFRDDNGIMQNPVFSVDESPARENFSRFLYEKMTKKK